MANSVSGGKPTFEGKIKDLKFDKVENKQDGAQTNETKADNSVFYAKSGKVFASADNNTNGKVSYEEYKGTGGGSVFNVETVVSDSDKQAVLSKYGKNTQNIVNEKFSGALTDTLKNIQGEATKLFSKFNAKVGHLNVTGNHNNEAFQGEVNTATQQLDAQVKQEAESYYSQVKQQVGDAYKDALTEIANQARELDNSENSYSKYDKDRDGKVSKEEQIGDGKYDDYVKGKAFTADIEYASAKGEGNGTANVDAQVEKIRQDAADMQSKVKYATLDASKDGVISQKEIIGNEKFDNDVKEKITDITYNALDEGAADKANADATKMLDEAKEAQAKKASAGDVEKDDGKKAEPKTHTVASGDTLSKIAKENGVSLQALIKANPQISNPNKIYPGDKINIPSGANDSAKGAGDKGQGQAVKGKGQGQVAKGQGQAAKDNAQTKGDGEVPQYLKKPDASTFFKTSWSEWANSPEGKDAIAKSDAAKKAAEAKANDPNYTQHYDAKLSPRKSGKPPVATFKDSEGVTHTYTGKTSGSSFSSNTRYNAKIENIKEQIKKDGFKDVTLIQTA